MFKIRPIVKRYKWQLIILLIIVGGLLFRYLAYTPYLTYVDSYKYLLQAQSFVNNVAHNYVTEQSGVFAKWGLSLVLGVINLPLHLSPEQLVTAAKLLNIALSMLLGILVLKFAKQKLLALPLFLSPLFFSYSSYVISEYLGLVLITLVLLLLFHKQRAAFNSHEIVAGLILGVLPLVRIEFMVVTLVLGAYLLLKYRQKPWINSVNILVSISGAFLFTCLLLSSFIGGENVLQTMLNLLGNVQYLLIAIVLVIAYVFMKLKLQYWLTLIVGVSVWAYLMLGAMSSFTLANAIITDPVLYIFVGISFGFMINRLFSLRLEVPPLFTELVVIIAGLIATYSVFNPDIDRYAITILGLVLLAVILFQNQYKLSFMQLFTKLMVAGTLIIAVRHVVMYPPQTADYQQQVVMQIPASYGRGQLVESGYLYLADLYFAETQPVLADGLKLEDIKTGQVLVLDDSLQVANPDLYAGVSANRGLFTQVWEFPQPREFNYSGGQVFSGNDVVLLLKN